MGIPLNPRYVNPAASSFVAASTLPAMTFLGEDVGNTDLTYEIQVATDSAFTSNPSSAKDDIASGTGLGVQLQGVVGSREAIAMPFVAASSYLLTSVDMSLKKLNSPTDNLTVKITTTPGGASLATSNTINGATLTTSVATYNFTFASSASITSGSTFYIELYRSGSVDTTNYYIWDGRNTAPLLGQTKSSGSWSSSFMNLTAKTYGSSGTIILDKTSDANLGFSGTPDNTDPFTTGQEVTYTVQTGEELSVSTTYYWRVRAKDANNPYGAWSTDVLVRPPGAWLRA